MHQSIRYSVPAFVQHFAPLIDQVAISTSSWNWFHECTSGITYGETNKRIRYSYFTSAFERLSGFLGNICTCLGNWPDKVPPNRGQSTSYILIVVHVSIHVTVLKYDHRLTMSKRVQRVIFYLYSVISHSTIPGHAACIAPKSIRLSHFSSASYWGKFWESSCFSPFRAFRLLFFDRASRIPRSNSDETPNLKHNCKYKRYTNRENLVAHRC